MSDQIVAKTKKKRKNTYSDEFVAAALVLMEVNGYPERGAIAKTSKAMGVPTNTLMSWQTEQARNKHETRSFESIRSSLAHMWEGSAGKLHGSAIERMGEMSAFQQLTGAAIATDKLDNLTRGPQVRIDVRVNANMGDISTPWVVADEVVDAEVREIPALETGADMDKA